MTKFPLTRSTAFNQSASLGMITAILGIALILVSPAVAQWHSDSTHNTAVCDTIGQQDEPQGCTDGADGAIFVWRDARKGITQIYAQHINASGIATWGKNGVKLGTAPTTPAQALPVICTDDNGGAYVVWQSARFATQFGTCLYAQHIMADGSLAYPDSALPVGIGFNGLANQVLCDDGRGGAYVAWEDNRASAVGTRPDIYMNRLWPGGVKFGVSTTGTNGTYTLAYTTYFPTVHHPAAFHDSSAHFQQYMVGLILSVPGKGNYTISGVDNDTTMEIKSPPAVAFNNLPYSILGPIGLVVDTVQNKQSKPAIVKDGTGGCYLAWITSATSPNSVYGTRIDSNGTQLWDPAPKPGYQLYKSSSPTSSSKNISLSLDGSQLLLAWEVADPSVSNGQEVFANRMNNASLYDTSFAWGNAVSVTQGWPLDQTTPKIFGDDSVAFGVRGALVPFVDQEPGGNGDYDIAMKRIKGDGGTLIPDLGFWYLSYKSNGQVDLKAVKVTDNSGTGTGTGILGVWEDFSSGVDTMIYAQRMDRNGKTYFGTSPTWGLCISGNGGASKQWTAKQPCIVARSDGAIVGWTDFRSGTAAIYCQLIKMDGSLSIPYDTAPPVLTVQSMTGSYNGSLCNTRCYDVIAVDTGTLKTGIDTVTPVAMNNMQLQTPGFNPGAASATFSVCVLDSMQDGTGTVSVSDENLNIQNTTFTYCTIPDSLPPGITSDLAQSPNWLVINLHDDGPWDRGLKSDNIKYVSNVKLDSSSLSIKAGDSIYTLTATIIDSTQPAHFSIQAKDVAGHTSSIDTFKYSTTAGVTQTSNDQISISIFPNPTSGATTIWLDGAPAAEVTILDVLGREVDRFRLEGSHEWQPASLAPGAYIVRAVVGDVVVFKRIVRE